MKIIKEYNELISDLIEARIEEIEDGEETSMLRDVLRYGHNGYINIDKESLIKEALRKNIYGENVKFIIIK